VDGDHNQAADDLNAWMPNVMDGGIVAVHDSNFASVILAVADRTDLVEIERSDRTRVYRKENLYESYKYEDQTLLVRKGIGYADDKTTLPEVRTYDIGPDPVRTCIDVGANIGAFVTWIKDLWPGAQIAALEPERSAYNMLYRNASILGLTCYRSAVLYDQNDKVLYVNPNNSGCHRVLPAGDAPVGLEVVPIDTTLTLEDVMRDRGWTSLDLLKVDAEGSEVDIFTYCSDEFLRKTRRIVGEFHAGYDAFMAGIGQRLIDLDFTVWAQPDPKAHATFRAINTVWVEPTPEPEPPIEYGTVVEEKPKKKPGRPKKSQ
jgi:FkbM family methyltransferase